MKKKTSSSPRHPPTNTAATSAIAITKYFAGAGARLLTGVAHRSARGVACCNARAA
jgi:hypothetical protein